MEDDEYNFMVKAFEVEGNDDDIDLNVPPTSGAEYLRRVQLEYKQCPTVVVADLDTQQFCNKQTVKISDCNGFTPAPPGYAPSVKWQNRQISSFSDLRQKLRARKPKEEDLHVKTISFPKANNERGWCNFCLGFKVSSKIHENHSSDDSKQGPKSCKRIRKRSGQDIDGFPPLLSVLFSLSQPTIELLLTYHVSWLGATGFTHHQGQWIYALLSCLEKPLTPDTCDTLRTMARVCADLRANLESKYDSALIPLNLVICLVANYFDQKDMMDSDTENEEDSDI